MEVEDDVDGPSLLHGTTFETVPSEVATQQHRCTLSVLLGL